MTVKDSGESMSLKEELKEQAFNLGADLYGVVEASRFDDAPSGHRPTDVLSGAKSVVVLGMKYLDGMVELLPVGKGAGDYPESPREKMFVGHNAFLSAQLDRVGYALARDLERKGFKTYHQLASQGGTDDRYLIGMLSLKHIATEAGLGTFGHHSLLVTPQYGPRVRLTAIVTDAEIEPTDKPLAVNLCDECVKKPCISQCPAGAIKEPGKTEVYSLDKFLCAQYRRTRPTCSVCMKVCVGGRTS
jgi:epoxyqueuosine reductase QueG